MLRFIIWTLLVIVLCLIPSDAEGMLSSCPPSASHRAPRVKGKVNGANDAPPLTRLRLDARGLCS